MLFEYSKCKKCNHINPAYKNICTECKSYLRERVVNIDLWNTIQLIILDPTKAFRQIIFAENKNFIFFITFFIAVKNLLIARFLSVPALGIDRVTSSFVLSLFLILVITVALNVSISMLQRAFYDKKNIKLRFKDIFASNTYSFIPYLFGLIFIFPVELIVLGGDIFSNNPYSFQIKPLITYILLGFEFIAVIWSFYFIYKSTITITINRNYSIISTFLYFILWFVVLYLSSKLVFSI